MSGIDDAIKNLGTGARIDVGVANFAQLRALIAPAADGGWVATATAGAGL